MKIASRMNAIDSSGIRKVFDLGQKLKDPVNLSIGQPDYDVPVEVKSAAVRSIFEGKNKYTVTQGIPELREKIKAHIEKEKQCSLEDIMITSGVSGSILLAFLSMLDAGDELIVPDPYFVMYKHLSRLIGAVPIYLPLEKDFSYDVGKLESLITPKTRMIVLNSPSNPTGVINTSSELKAIAKIAQKYGLLVISDEIYDSFVYEKEYESIARYYPETLVIGGFSKSHAMTGWRVGYAAGPGTLIREMIKIQQYTFVCSPSFAQYSALTALDCDTTHYKEDYRRKRDLIYNGIKDAFAVRKPDGAFYIFPKAPGGVGSKFAEKAVENNLLIIPGNVFSEHDTHVRISFAAPDETIVRGIEILNKLAAQY
ncbi:aminotransferase class I/II-fold pyridoxal phosphate-dependent enzyme [bacterium]|nr:aminotransferase class I/II-fold pyridoxal phosphate-dependent enzyme [bacterium]